MRIRPVICMPEPPFMGEEESKQGYWGFVRSRRDYDEESSRVLGELRGVLQGLRGEGYEVSLLPLVELPPDARYGEAYKLFEELSAAELNVIFPFGFPRASLEVALAASKYAVIFDKYQPIYSGTLFAPPLVKHYREYGFRGVMMVEGDWEELKRVIRVVYSLYRIRRAKLVVVGPVNSAFGGLRTFKRSLDLFGFKPIFYTYDEFVNLFNRLWRDEGARREAEELVEKLVSHANRVVEPTREELMRAAVYHLALRKLVDENGADWVTVNCLSELISRTGATPCLSFSLLNDEGIVATCEADPAMMALHYILTRLAARPAVFADPAVNVAGGTLVLAHCTSPTRVLGYRMPGTPYEVRTHHESGTGATVKPEYPEGVVTIAGLSFDLKRMLVVRGRAVGSPDLRICRAQLEVEVPNAREVLRKWQGFHWVYVYGDYTRELEMLAELKGISPIVVK